MEDCIILNNATKLRIIKEFRKKKINRTYFFYEEKCLTY